MKTNPTNGLLSVRVPKEVLSEIDGLAKASRLERSEYVKLWLGVIGRLKREYALAAVTSIPPDMLKGYPGRPTDEAAGKVT